MWLVACAAMTAVDLICRASGPAPRPLQHRHRVIDRRHLETSLGERHRMLTGATAQIHYRGRRR
jgi:hypothetical protein